MLLPDFLNEPEETFFTSSCVTANETSVCGTFSSSKVPLMLSLPPMEAVSIDFCASIAPRRAAAGNPHVFSFTARPKNS